MKSMLFVICLVVMVAAPAYAQCKCEIVPEPSLYSVYMPAIAYQSGSGTPAPAIMTPTPTITPTASATPTNVPKPTVTLVLLPTNTVVP